MRFISVFTFLIFLFVSQQIFGDIKIGSKAFSESVLLGEILCKHLETKGQKCQHISGFGGSAVVWRALLNGEIDAYVEYTGTLKQELLSKHQFASDKQLEKWLESQSLSLTKGIGFSNSYGVGISRELSNKYGVRNLEDLGRLPAQVRVALSQEFYTRSDGWPRLKSKYDLNFEDVSSMEHELSYRAFANKYADVVDVYTTDPEILLNDVVVLNDSGGFFSDYTAVILFRNDGRLNRGHFSELEGVIDTKTMQELNLSVKVNRHSEAQVAQKWLDEKFSHIVSPKNSVQEVRFWGDLKRHLALVFIPLFFNILFGIPLGIYCAYHSRSGNWVMHVTSIIQTIPSLALLVFMIPIFGIGYPAAAFALFLYGLLPIVRSTCTGITGISPGLRESAQVLGLSFSSQLFRVELPLAAPIIFSGIKIAAVIGVGTATLGAFIGAGGFGEPIMIGIRRDDFQLILQGAVPAAVLAIVVQSFFGRFEKFLNRTS